MTQGAVSRQIKLLELQLKTSLFHRQPRTLELTPNGSLYLATVREAFDMIEGASRRLTRTGSVRVLTVSVLPTLAMNWIIPHLHEFNEVHPDVEIHMVTSINPVDFDTDIDMAIRVGSPHATGKDKNLARIDLVMTEDWSGIEMEELMADSIVPVCAPSLLQGPRALRSIEDLRFQTLLHNATRPHAWADWLDATGPHTVPTDRGPRFGHFFMAIEAARQGKGVACVPDVLTAADLASGRLVAPFPRPAASTGAYYILYRRQRRELTQLRAFSTWLMQLAARTQRPPAGSNGVARVTA